MYVYMLADTKLALRFKDLTFAALSASVIVPPMYGVPLPQPDVLSPGMATLVAAVTARVIRVASRRPAASAVPSPQSRWADRGHGKAKIRGGLHWGGHI